MRIVFGAATKTQENVSDAQMVAAASPVKIHVLQVGRSAKAVTKAVATALNAIRERMTQQVGVERLVANVQTLIAMTRRVNAKEHAYLDGLELSVINLAPPHVKNQRFALMMNVFVDQATFRAPWAHVRNLLGVV